GDGTAFGRRRQPAGRRGTVLWRGRTRYGATGAGGRGEGRIGPLKALLTADWDLVPDLHEVVRATAQWAPGAPGTGRHRRLRGTRSGPPEREEGRGPRLMESTVPEAAAIRSDFSLDRAIAAIASLPFAWMAYYRLVVQGVDLPHAAVAINYALLIVTMVMRRPPPRVTTKPLYWVTAFVATFWTCITFCLVLRGHPFASTP